MAKAEIENFIKAREITQTVKFVPFSASRNKAEKDKNLNWIVTLQVKGRDILSTDYMAGQAHCPGYKQKDRATRENMVDLECETGRAAEKIWGNSDKVRATRREILPELVNVLYSLSMDASVLDARGFEEWAGDFGYDADSRKAEAIYRACLDIALKLRAGLGDDGLRELAEACQDY